MKNILAVATTMMLLGSAVLAQDTGGDKNKKTPTETKAVQKTGARKAGAASQANPLPTKKSVEKTALNPQPLPPGPQSAGQKSSSASKVELNPQPLPPGARQPAAATAKLASQKKGATAKSKKNSSPSTGSTTPK